MKKLSTKIINCNNDVLLQATAKYTFKVKGKLEIHANMSNTSSEKGKG